MAGFNTENNRLDTVRATVPADHRVRIFANLFVITQREDLSCSWGVVGDDRAGFAKRADIFTRIETEAAGTTQRVGGSSLVFAAIGPGRRGW